MDDSLKHAQKKYEASEKGRDRAKRYNDSEKGKARKRKYLQNLSPEQKKKQREAKRISARRYREKKRSLKCDD